MLTLNSPKRNVNADNLSLVLRLLPLLFAMLQWDARAARLFHEGFDCLKVDESGHSVATGLLWENDKPQFAVESGCLEYNGFKVLAGNDVVTTCINSAVGRAEEASKAYTGAGADGARSAGRLTLSRGPHVSIDRIRIGRVWAVVMPTSSLRSLANNTH